MSWRKIDIDQFDEDTYTQDEFLAEFESPLPADQVNATIQARTTDIRNLLTRGDQNAALSLALVDPPYGRHLGVAKNMATQTVVDVLTQFRATDITPFINSISQDEQDILMKYLFAGMAKPELTEIAGTGSIVRVMTDKRTVV
ncbi:actin-related protein 2/3 complex subunit 5 [Phycomyces nitens]|nr:actin-related protein 2/3 complex subunit 5 [Phycomyces nitens]